MPKIKKRRVPVKIDMTPMVDVAFLLLTFFMLTTQFTPPQEVKIQVPYSHSTFKEPNSNVMTIYVSKEEKIYLGVDQPALMARLFGQDARLQREVEVNLQNLPDLLIQARIANPKLRTLIKGDANSDYGVVSDIMEILQRTKITRFAMITNLAEK